MTLILKHANKNRLGAIDWGTNDFDVCVSDRCIGRIFLAPQSPPDHSWMWTITARDYPRTIYSRGYSATREQAMAEFKGAVARSFTADLIRLGVEQKLKRRCNR